MVAGSSIHRRGSRRSHARREEPAMKENETGIPGLKTMRHEALRALHKIAWLAPLAARVSLGVVFAETGWGKVHDLGKVSGFFAKLGIPAPDFMAGLVGYSE